MFSFVDIRLALLLSAAVLLARGEGEDDISHGSCTFDGQLYIDKSEWKPELCKTCFCESGLVACYQVICVVTPDCAYPNGECCPVCPADGTPP
ncbi:collagen alpha-1(I) chain [Hippoglossus stenolepis]|uniref:collagen alpha-1(I) chain n=1 Tax=Hippoglossus stenolepis TaxID=195615 RepID=UPI001FAF59DE|nr:collagen alpha-1(I) chain [Hippoglossus stenolepis]